MEIAPTWSHVARIWWALLWRGVLVMIATAIAGFVIGAVLGFLLGMLGAALATVQVICGVVGALLGLAGSLLPIRLVLGKDFGTFRLVLVSSESRPG